MEKLTLTNAAEGEHPNGIITYTASVKITHGNPLVFDGDKVKVATTLTDPVIGIALDGADAGDIIPVGILGGYRGTVLLCAGGAIAAGVQVTAKGTATGADTDVIIGRALQSATATGDLIEIAHQVAQVK